MFSNDSFAEEPGYFETFFGFIGDYWWIGGFLFLAWCAITIVDQGYKGVVTRMGKFSRVLGPGPHLIIPFFESVEQVMIMEQVLNVEHDGTKEKVITKDNVPLDGITAIVYLAVADPVKACFEIEDYSDAIEGLVQSTLRNKIGTMDLSELLSGRQKINAEVTNDIDTAATSWGIDIIRVEVLEIRLTPEVAEAMSQVIAAQTQGKAKLALAEAQARAIEAIDNSLRTKPAAAEYQITLEKLRVLDRMGDNANSKLVFLPTELASSVAGMATFMATTDDVAKPASVD